MTIDLSQVHTLFLVVLPALVGVLAGLIRQNKLPNWLNELILYIIVAVVAQYCSWKKLTWFRANRYQYRRPSCDCYPCTTF